MNETDTNRDDPTAPDDQQEDASDYVQDLRGTETQAVLSATDWTTQTVLIQLTKGNIELNPDFQRRDAWRQARKSRFIESLILGIPIPQLVLAERKSKRNSFIVIDGKQRLLALRQFCADENDALFKRFPLRDLNIRSDLNGKYFSDISVDENHSQDVTNFENGAIRTVVIRNWPNEKFLYQVFLRLNTGSVPLSPQELRQALHPGPFSSFIDSFSGRSTEILSILGLDAPDFRMRDAELVIRYFAFRNYIHDYKGNLSPLLDLTTERFNALWERGDQALIESQAEDLLASIRFTTDVFAADAFRKWNGRSFEKSLNRAVFDVMVLFFDKEETRASAQGKAAEIKRSFQTLCERDPDFRSSIEGTTKSIDAIYTRLSHWRNRLQEIVGDNNIKPLSLANGKIVL